jgi:hypothetical protein
MNHKAWTLFKMLFGSRIRETINAFRRKPRGAK